MNLYFDFSLSIVFSLYVMDKIRQIFEIFILEFLINYYVHFYS